MRSVGEVCVLCAALALVIPVGVGAQEGCRYANDGNDELRSSTTPGGGRVTNIRNPHFLCDDGVEIWADSAVAYSEQAMSQLIGAVRYRDRTRELRADQARYFTEVGRLQAQGRVRVTNSEDGSVVENGDLVYLRQTDFREQEEMTVTTGRDGIRPRAHVQPASPDSMPADAEPARPYIVEGDSIVLRGSAYFRSTGDVRIERDSLFAFGDDAEYDESTSQLVLVGSARVENGGYTLVGRTITLGTSETDANEIDARRDALMTGEDIVVDAPRITLHLMDGALERLVAVPLPVDSTAAPDAQPDSSDAARPLALAADFELTADSLELIAPGDVVERIFAAGSARSVSRSRDSLNVELLPEIARSDWLEGDTVVISLIPVTDTTGATDSDRNYQVDRIVARVGARSLYRLEPEDSTAVAGTDPPAVHYVMGDEITLIMANGTVQGMEVVGQTRGVHLEPLAAEPDSVSTVQDAPPTNNDDFSFAVGGRDAPTALGANPPIRRSVRRRRSWNRR